MLLFKGGRTSVDTWCHGLGEQIGVSCIVYRVSLDAYKA